MEQLGNIKVLKLKKTGYEAGFVHGQSLRKEVKGILRDFFGEFPNILQKEISIAEIKKEAGKYDEHIPRKYQEEMKGIADGAGVDYVDILLLNCYEDIINTFLCSSITSLKSKEIPLIHGRNLDYYIKSIVKNTVVFDYFEDGFIVIGFPGYIGAVTATNYKGISLTYNFAHHAGESKIGIPSGIICREIIEKSTSMSEVSDIINKADRTVFNLIMVSSQRENDAQVFETSPSSIAVRKQENGSICATNHFFVHDDAEESQEISNKIDPTSETRYNKLQKSAKEETLNLNKTKEALNQVSLSGDFPTVQTVIFVPEENKVYLANGNTIPPSKDGDYIVYEYNK